MYLRHLRQHIWLSYGGLITFVDRIIGLLVRGNVTANQNPSSSPPQQNPDANTLHVLFLCFCAFMCQLINFAETLVQRGSFPLLPGVSPRHLICVSPIGLPAAHQPRKQLVSAPFFFLSLSLSFSPRARWLQHERAPTQRRHKWPFSFSHLARAPLVWQIAEAEPNKPGCSVLLESNEDECAWEEQSNFQSHANMQATRTTIAEGGGYFSNGASQGGLIRTGSFLKPLFTCRHPAQTQLTRLIIH